MNDCRDNEQAIAIVGMAGRFPGSASVRDLWQALQAGREAACPVSNEELRASGIDEAAIASNDYVKSSMKLEGLDRFDASFFGYSPKQAESIDPQQRIFLECAWEALENSGCSVESFGGLVGVFAGAGSNTYQLAKLRNAARQEGTKAPHDRPSFIDTEKDYLTTRVSYKLGLTGPSIAVQTACSSSLVAVHLACQSLLSNECDMALAGGVSGVAQHLGPGYWYIRDGIYSPDGHCRAFDAKASGTVFASGAGVVVLRRLKDALRDGNLIHAVIAATAINNDGAAKAGYTAPSIQGQADVIATAQSLAGVGPADIGMIEAHGTGTVLGDAIELSALRQVFGAGRKPDAPCTLGSLKTNIGHLDAAAGVAGLIKATLCLEHRTLVPSLHFEQPNPLLAEDDLFFVNTQCRPWLAGNGKPRRAGVSSFGIGGTNAHAILEEFPQEQRAARSSRPHIVPLSASTPTALTQIVRNLVTTLSGENPALGDVAYTLQVGRKRFAQRAVFVADSTEGLVEQLQRTLAGQSLQRSGAVHREMERLAQSWIDGDPVDWAALHAGSTPKRIELPTYPFERERFWLPTPTANVPMARAEQGPVRRAPDDWYYIRSWRASLMPALPSSFASRDETWLIFATPDPVCLQVVERLRAAGCPVAVVHPGEAFAQTGEGTYSIVPDSAAQYAMLLDHVTRRHGAIRRVMHLWSLTREEPALTVEALEALQPVACFSLLYLAQALAATDSRDAVSVLVVTNELNDITGAEVGHPGKAPLTALCNTISQEMTHIRCTLLELGEEPAAERLIAETVLEGNDAVIAYRGRRRLIQCFEPVRMTPQQAGVRALHSEGVYVLIGGLGTVGLAVAERLVRDCQARLVLITRGNFPEYTEWKRLASGTDNDSVEARRIRRLLQMEAAGGCIRVITADAADESALERAFETAEAQFGPVRGVFHLAAETRHISLNRRLRDLVPAHFQVQLRPKAAALCALHRVLEKRTPDFVILFSSNASVLGGLGLTAYAAANACLDGGAALATAKSQSTTWTATNWDRWLEPDVHTGHAPADVPYAFSTEEGLDALWRILRVSTVSQVVVSVSDLSGRLATWTGSRALTQPVASEAAAPGEAERPAATAPRSGFENQIADIWKDVLGAAQVGSDESFLDLGGDSLIALRVTARIREIFEVDIPLPVFFSERPTVAALAVEVVSQLAQRADQQALESELAALAVPARNAAVLATAGVN